MRCLFVALLTGVLLSGCASTPQDPSGTWINQAAIEAAVESGNLREALLAYGPNLEWQLDSPRQLASFSNGFERGEGRFKRQADGELRVHFYGDFEESLSLNNDELIQAQSDTWPEQRFVRQRRNQAAMHEAARIAVRLSEPEADRDFPRRAARIKRLPGIGEPRFAEMRRVAFGRSEFRHGTDFPPGAPARPAFPSRQSLEASASSQRDDRLPSRDKQCAHDPRVHPQRMALQ
jgi:hypothetical protein